MSDRAARGHLLDALLVAGTLRSSDRLMLSVLLGVMGIYTLYWYSGGPDFGARYWPPSLQPG